MAFCKQLLQLSHFIPLIKVHVLLVEALDELVLRHFFLVRLHLRLPGVFVGALLLLLLHLLRLALLHLKVLDALLLVLNILLQALVLVLLELVLVLLQKVQLPHDPHLVFQGHWPEEGFDHLRLVKDWVRGSSSSSCDPPSPRIACSLEQSR